MTIPQIITAARARIAALEPNPICSETHAAKLLRNDALAILDEMAAQIKAADCACPYRRSVGGEDWCEFPGVKGTDYLQPEAFKGE
jgi:hypothetical protein